MAERDKPPFNRPERREGDDFPPRIGPQTTSNTDAHGPTRHDERIGAPDKGPDAPLAVGADAPTDDPADTANTDAQSDGSQPRPHSTDTSERMAEEDPKAARAVIGGDLDRPRSHDPDRRGSEGELRSEV